MKTEIITSSDLTIKKLINALNSTPLDPVFEPEKYGNFISIVNKALFIDDSGWQHYKWATHHFSGNFYNLSLCFSIYTNDDQLVDKLTALVRANQSTKEYKDATKQREISKQFLANEAKKQREQAKTWLV